MDERRPILLFSNRLIENSEHREVSPEHDWHYLSCCLCSGEPLLWSGERKIAISTICHARTKDWTWNNIGEKKVIDQKVGLKNYQHYLTSVAVAQVARGAPLNLNIKIFNFGKKNCSQGVFSHYPDQNILLLFLPISWNLPSQRRNKTSHASFPAPGNTDWMAGWLVNGTGDTSWW